VFRRRLEPCLLDGVDALSILAADHAQVGDEVQAREPAALQPDHAHVHRRRFLLRRPIDHRLPEVQVPSRQRHKTGTPFGWPFRDAHEQHDTVFSLNGPRIKDADDLPSRARRRQIRRTKQALVEQTSNRLHKEPCLMVSCAQ
jgi:hypothetical protein